MTRKTTLRIASGSVCIATIALLAAAALKKPAQPTYYDKPDAYDLAAIQRDPASYYSRSVPSRVWQMMPIASGQERYEEIKIQGEAFRFVLANGEKAIPLLVRAKSGRPVTFTALDQGHFVNNQFSLTVPADENGYAQTDFWVGDVGDFRVLAGSPENQGPAEFTFQALSLKELQSLENGDYAKRYRAEISQDRSEKIRATPSQDRSGGK